MGEETKEKGEGIEGNEGNLRETEGKGEGTEKKPEGNLIPPEWIGIPIKNYIEKVNFCYYLFSQCSVR